MSTRNRDTPIDTAVARRMVDALIDQAADQLHDLRTCYGVERPKRARALRDIAESLEIGLAWREALAEEGDDGRDLGHPQ